MYVCSLCGWQEKPRVVSECEADVMLEANALPAAVKAFREAVRLLDGVESSLDAEGRAALLDVRLALSVAQLVVAG